MALPRHKANAVARLLGLYLNNGEHVGKGKEESLLLPHQVLLVVFWVLVLHEKPYHDDDGDDDNYVGWHII